MCAGSPNSETRIPESNPNDQSPDEEKSATPRAAFGWSLGYWSLGVDSGIRISEFGFSQTFRDTGTATHPNRDESKNNILGMTIRAVRFLSIQRQRRREGYHAGDSEAGNPRLPALSNRSHGSVFA
jgi:hypothetical protein